MSDRLEQLTRLHESDPTDPFITYGIAFEYAKSDQPQQAIDWLNKTLELDPHYCYAYFQKGKAFSALGDEDKAAEAVREGIRVSEEIGDDHARHELADLLLTLQ